ncbi:hypothetical protein IWW37_001194 [Coemansia sp. RSA 2050]|nr:hypothetical protein IWW37_001194 [Coemansia sp. RSA 2050]KAJ2733784.1 hypothetical protein IW152_002776 [Coemansia sp. BCRC 34962]
MSALYVPAEPRFAIHRSEYALDPITGAPTKLTGDSGSAGEDGASFISVLVMAHSGADKSNKPGMVWVWAQVTPGRRARTSAMTNLVLSMPPSSGLYTRASSSQLMGSGAADDPTVDIGRRLSSRFKRPIFVSLNNVSTSRLTASAVVAGPSLALSMVQADELVALESCLVAELRMALSSA